MTEAVAVHTDAATAGRVQPKFGRTGFAGAWRDVDNSTSMEPRRSTWLAWLSESSASRPDQSELRLFYELGNTLVSDWSSRYASLLNVLSAMHDLQEDDDQSINSETWADAERVLSHIRAHGIRPPKVFSHGGDAVVFTWEQPDVLRYMTISGGDFSVLDVHRRSRVKCKSALTPIRSAEADKKLQEMQGTTSLEAE